MRPPLADVPETRRLTIRHASVRIPVWTPLGFGAVEIGPLRRGASETVEINGHAVTVTREALIGGGQMAKKSNRSSNEQTSATVASIAGQILRGRQVDDAVAWLQEVADAPETGEGARNHAIALLGAIGQMRRVAASALTQRERS